MAPPDGSPRSRAAARKKANGSETSAAAAARIACSASASVRSVNGSTDHRAKSNGTG